jgi:hypothetical protein
MSIIDELRARRLPLIVIVLWLFSGASLLWNIGPIKAFWLLTSHYSLWGDIFFKYFTHIGDGLFFILICVLLFIAKRKKEALFFTIENSQ